MVTVVVQPRLMVGVGLMAMALGAAGAVLLAVTGPKTLPAAAAYTASVALVFRLLAVIAGISAVVGLATNRSWPVGVMLIVGMMMLGYVGGYLYAQSLGIWYPPR